MSPEPRAGVDREQLQWSFELGGVRHELDLLPELIAGLVAVALDGRVVARPSIPKAQQPWVETTVEVAGEAITVVLTANQVMKTDLFVGGRSLVDGRTVDEVRAGAPMPVRGYDLWFTNFVVKEWPTLRLFASLIALACILGLIVGGAYGMQGSPRDRAVRAGIVTAAGLSTWLVAMWVWILGTSWVNTRLLSRPDFGAAPRLLILAGAIIGLPILIALAVAIVVLILR